MLTVIIIVKQIKYSLAHTKRLSKHSQKWISRRALLLAQDTSEAFTVELFLQAARSTKGRKIKSEHLEQAISNPKLWQKVATYLLNSIYNKEEKRTTILFPPVKPPLKEKSRIPSVTVKTRW